MGRKAVAREKEKMSDEEAFQKVWNKKCIVCGSSPIVRATDMCGPCTWGEADTAGGNW